MEFDVKSSGTVKNEEKFSKESLHLSFEFAKLMKQEFNDFVKAIVLFGSSAKNTNQQSSDIDILVIVDDLSIEMSAEVVESYRLITEKIIGKVSKKLHITSLKYVTFWDYVREANPVAVNILRDGVPLIDTGFIAPLQQLLRRGNIKPSLESIYQYFTRSSTALQNARGVLLQGAMDLYWSVVDAAQSLLMRKEIVSPSPEHIAHLMELQLLPQGILKKHHVDVMKEFYTLSRIIMHNELKYMSGKDYDEYYKKAYDFVSDVKTELEKNV